MNNPITIFDCNLDEIPDFAVNVAMLGSDGYTTECETTFKEFIKANEFEIDQVNEMLDCLNVFGKYEFGGGAMPYITITEL